MFSHWVDEDLLFVGLFGAVALFLGIAGLLIRSGSVWYRRGLVATTLLLGGAGGTAAVAGVSRGVWLAPLLSAGLSAFCLLLTAPWLERGCAQLLSLLHSSRVPCAILIVSPVLAAGWVSWLNGPLAVWRFDAQPSAQADVPLVPIADAVAYTDAGQPVSLFRPARPGSIQELRDAEASFLDGANLTAHVIRTAPPNDDTNCHGWIFTGGRYWIQGDDVYQILHDNDYRAVSSPQSGDLVVYRADAEGKVIAHCGIVRAVSAGGPVLVESKLRRGGRFLHEPVAVPYGIAYEYYRTARPGHGLRLAATPEAAR
jgi:hypothetical protein